MSVHSAAGTAQPVYNVFNMPPVALQAPDPELTLAVQSISCADDNEQKPSVGVSSVEKPFPNTSMASEADREAATAVSNLPNYEPLSDDEA